ncbi:MULTISPECIES: ABC transporter substrate-binding protein [unclassified Mycolicibacterium]|uniref:ABC transporter substrate-binding protein n=1 Tax=unclassified Mycolicibacterium TaxID=2636767 RepID=UPI0012DC2EAA|nr:MULTISPECIES: ABC transporter substrate-binding protein [unclassified Mycolicibacterium]MUL85659.1 substrate-binding domain-containing protein [Mycolicibacterium sp. CBMA 329]MUL91536.1 substrate-binding domain-containing protein [Mycolicibacterium sp. CBMA 331]MUM02224.1 substrate-binding domain-containing protein [Mycolicibacterium sp. CBMA 334]MUM27317.1 substrate-binding domain-containing protein [Mycolicibacterium sp. CBMA 295]MUM41174.1 substrate-binding domain-containing protein [Myc
MTHAWKTSAAALAVGVLALSACSAGNNEHRGEGGAQSTEIAFVNASPADEFSISLECAARDAVAAHPGMSLNYQASRNWDATEQKSVLDAALAANPGALLVVPTDSTALQKPLQDAAKSGVKVVLLDTSVDDPSFASSAIATDNVAAGATALDAIKQRHPGGKVLTISVAPGITSTGDREKGFADAIGKDPNFQYLGVQYDPGMTITKAAQIVAAALQKDPDIVGIFATNNAQTEGVVAGIKQVGRQGQVTVVGFDPTPATAKLVENGSVDALVAQQPSTIGQTGIEQALAAMEGKQTEPKIGTGTFLITKDNIDGEGAKYIYKTKC